MGWVLWCLMCVFAAIGFVGSLFALLLWIEYRRISKLIEQELSI